MAGGGGGRGGQAGGRVRGPPCDGPGLEVLGESQVTNTGLGTAVVLADSRVAAVGGWDGRLRIFSWRWPELVGGGLLEPVDGGLLEPMDESTPVSSVGNRAAAATVPSLTAFTVPSSVAARVSLARLLALAPHSACALLTARETSEAVQGFVAQLLHTDLQPLLAIVLDNFRVLSLNRSVQSFNLLTE